MANFEKTFITLALFGLMVIAIFSFVINVQNDNEASDGIINNDLVNNTYSDLGGKIDNDVRSAESSYVSFNENNPTIDAGQIVLSTIVSAGKVFNGMGIGFYTIIVKLPARYLGIDEKVLGIIFTIIVLVIIIGLYILARVGA